LVVAARSGAHPHNIRAKILYVEQILPAQGAGQPNQKTLVMRFLNQLLQRGPGDEFQQSPAIFYGRVQKTARNACLGCKSGRHCGGKVSARS
jgi:hypothetical protein